MFTLVVVVVPGVDAVVCPGRFFAAAFVFLFAILLCTVRESWKKKTENASPRLYEALR